MNVRLTKPLGFVELDSVWLDDRATCGWALSDVSLVIEPGQTIAVLGDAAGDAVIDLVAGNRMAVRGSVGIDGVDVRDLDRVAHRRALAADVNVASGERRLVVAGRTVLVARPAPATLERADLVLVCENGFEVARGRHAAPVTAA